MAEEVGDLTDGTRARGGIFATDVNSAKFLEEDFKEAVVDEGVPYVINIGGVDDGMGLARGDLDEFRVGTEDLEEDTLVIKESQGSSVRAVTELSGRRFVVVIEGVGDVKVGVTSSFVVRISGRGRGGRGGRRRGTGRLGVVVESEIGARIWEAVESRLFAGGRAVGVVTVDVVAVGKSSIEPRSRVVEGNREVAIRWRVVAEGLEWEGRGIRSVDGNRRLRGRGGYRLRLTHQAWLRPQ